MPRVISIKNAACIASAAVLCLSTLACFDSQASWRMPNGIDASAELAFRRISRQGRHGGLLAARYLPPGTSSTPQPLVVYLHGSGGRGDDNVQHLHGLPLQLFHSRQQACAVLAPQCPEWSSWLNWLPEIKSMIDEILRNQNIDPDRVYLTGLSMGADGSWELAARHPELFAAFVPVCGWPKLETAGAFVNLPIWAVHGSDDQLVPPRATREMIAALQFTGRDAQLTDLPGVGHNSWDYAYDPANGVLGWMFSQRRHCHTEDQD